MSESGIEQKLYVPSAAKHSTQGTGSKTSSQIQKRTRFRSLAAGFPDQSSITR